MFLLDFVGIWFDSRIDLVEFVYDYFWVFLGWVMIISNNIVLLWMCMLDDINS